MTNAENYSLQLQLSQSLFQAVEEFAKQEGISMNQFIANAVAEKVNTLRMVAFFSKPLARADVTGEGGEAPLPEDVLD